MMIRPGKYLKTHIYADWDRTVFILMDELIDTKGVACEVGFSHRTIQSWEAKGWMPHRQKRGKELLYRRVDIAQVKAALESAINVNANG